MLGDDGFQRTPLAHRAGVLATQRIQVPLAGSFGGALIVELLSRFIDLRRERDHALRGSFKLQSELTLLATERFQLQNGGGGFVVQTLRFAIERGDEIGRASCRERGEISVVAAS